jgi:hypothetical protein
MPKPLESRFHSFIIGKGMAMEQEQQTTIVEMIAMQTIVAAQIKALIATHPDRNALRGFFASEVERHTARSLGMAVPDALAERIQALALKAFQDIDADYPTR